MTPAPSFPSKMTEKKVNVNPSGPVAPVIIQGAHSNKPNSKNPFKTVTANPSNPAYTFHQVDPDELVSSSKPSILPSSGHPAKKETNPYMVPAPDSNLPMTYTNNPWIHGGVDYHPQTAQEVPPPQTITVTPPQPAPPEYNSVSNPHRNATFVPGIQTVLVTPPAIANDIVRIVDDSSKEQVAIELKKKSGDPWLNKSPWSGPPTATAQGNETRLPQTTTEHRAVTASTKVQKSKDPWENKNPWPDPPTAKA